MEYNPFSLRNKTVLITGASSGIGAATAILCAKMGAKLIITARNKERLKMVLSQLDEIGHQMILADLTNDKDIENMVAEIPSLDGIVHNAGISKMTPVKFLNKDIIEETVKTNFYAPVLITKNILKKKKLNRMASVVFISSISSFFAEIANSMYASSKGALNSFARVLALEMAPQRARVNSIQPGMVKTSLIQNGELTMEQLAEDEKRYPLGRYGKPEDIAGLVVYLLSDVSEWMTGNIINIDGGISLR
jgi:NAD(P)-dependent dehydrogenase (short-subunit alcohol dehydrogenase family)